MCGGSRRGHPRGEDSWVFLCRVCLFVTCWIFFCNMLNLKKNWVFCLEHVGLFVTRRSFCVWHMGLFVIYWQFLSVAGSFYVHFWNVFLEHIGLFVTFVTCLFLTRFVLLTRWVFFWDVVDLFNRTLSNKKNWLDIIREMMINRAFCWRFVSSIALTDVLNFLACKCMYYTSLLRPNEETISY